MNDILANSENSQTMKKAFSSQQNTKKPHHNYNNGNGNQHQNYNKDRKPQYYSSKNYSNKNNTGTGNNTSSQNVSKFKGSEVPKFEFKQREGNLLDINSCSNANAPQQLSFTDNTKYYERKGVNNNMRSNGNNNNGDGKLNNEKALGNELTGPPVFTGKVSSSIMGDKQDTKPKEKPVENEKPKGQVEDLEINRPVFINSKKPFNAESGASETLPESTSTEIKPENVSELYIYICKFILSLILKNSLTSS